MFDLFCYTHRIHGRILHIGKLGRKVTGRGSFRQFTVYVSVTTEDVDSLYSQITQCYQF